VLDELDVPANQLLVEARVVEVSASRDLEYELKHAWTTPDGRSTFLQSSAVDLAVPGPPTRAGAGRGAAVVGPGR
jgi:type II secretory pathway component GspD/PulD (secretin)